MNLRSLKVGRVIRNPPPCATASLDSTRQTGALGITRPTFCLTVFACAFTAVFASERDDWSTKMQPIVPLGYVVRHAAEPVVIDGKLDDAVWRGAPWTNDFVDIEGAAKPNPRFRTRAKLLWDEDYLYIAAELEEPHVWGTLTAHDSVIFRDPDFEVFIDPDGDTHAYSEFEINARNTSWDLLLDKPYQDGGPPRNEWEIPGLKTAVKVDGTLNKSSDTDRGWTVELAFPWSAFAAHARRVGAPSEGEQWRLNFSRVEWRVTTDDGVYAKVPNTPEDNWVWSPQGVIDMHRPEMWGVLQFTRRPAGEHMEVRPIPGKAARDLALEIYYAQRDFFAVHNRWAASLDELGWRTKTDALPTDVARTFQTTATPAERSVPGSGDVPVTVWEQTATGTSPLREISGIESAVLAATADGYECRAAMIAGEHRIVWTIHQDRRLSVQVEARTAEPVSGKLVR